MEQQMDILKRIEAKLDLLLGGGNKLWYPDDSGEWIEHVSGNAPNIDSRTMVETLSIGERNAKTWESNPMITAQWYWGRSSGHHTIVAYRIVK